MPLTKDEFDEACREICPQCKLDVGREQPSLKYRVATSEWTHTISQKGAVTHGLCWANGLRKSRFAEGLD